MCTYVNVNVDLLTENLSLMLNFFGIEACGHIRQSEYCSFEPNLRNALAQFKAHVFRKKVSYRYH